MSITKQKDGRYKVSVRPDGANGVRYQRLVKTKSEAVRLELELLSSSSAKFDSAKLSVIIDLWYDHFGCHLKDHKKRYSKLQYLVPMIGDRPISKLRPAHYLDFRKHRINNGITANTCNHDLAYLKTVFNKLQKSDYISVNPFQHISKLPMDEVELSYLTKYQIKRLLVACRHSKNESLLPVVLLALRTGARWSEAEQIKLSNINRLSVTYTATKNGKSRTVPITPEFSIYLRNRPVVKGRIFANCYKSFSNALKRANISLPKGQLTHVLRHSYASHFMMNGGDILTLQKILGHSDLKLTMRYAHLSPSHLQDALKYSPI